LGSKYSRRDAGKFLLPDVKTVDIRKSDDVPAFEDEWVYDAGEILCQVAVVAWLDGACDNVLRNGADRLRRFGF